MGVPILFVQKRIELNLTLVKVNNMLLVYGDPFHSHVAPQANVVMI